MPKSKSKAQVKEEAAEMAKAERPKPMRSNPTTKMVENGKRRRAGKAKRRGQASGRRERRKSREFGPFRSMEKLEQAWQIADLHLVGKTFVQIGRELDLDATTVSDTYYRLLGWTEGGAQATADQIREEEVKRLDDIYAKAMAMYEEATSVQGPDGVIHEDAAAKVRALQTALKASESKRKLFGIDQPDKHEHLGKDGASLILAGQVSSLETDELQNELSGFMAGAAAGFKAAAPPVRKKREASTADDPDNVLAPDPETVRGEAPAPPEPVEEPDAADVRGAPLF